MTTSIAIVGTSSGTAVDVNNDNAMFVDLRSPAIGTRGVYSIAGESGLLAATVGSGATMFSMRWTDATRVALIRRLSVIGIESGSITAGLRSDLQLFVARSFTVSDSAASNLTPSSTENILRTSMNGTLIAANDLRIASTVAITAGTRTLDTNPIGRALGFFPTTTPGAFVYGNFGGYASLLDRTAIGLHPLIISQNEGIVVTMSAAGPVTGTFVLSFQMEWIETAAY